VFYSVILPALPIGSPNDKLGKYAAYLWIVGFVLAFAPLYILGLMGATRRLDHYSASTGWQPLFIVAGIGAAIIACGVAMQIWQIIVSIMQREHTRDLTGDPWDGRTLEWSTASPAPSYNFAIIPEVSERDAFWAMKQERKKSKTDPPEPVYDPIYETKNTGLPLIIGVLAITFGFTFVWHIWWLAIISFLAIITSLIYRMTSDPPEHKITVKEIQKIEAARGDYV
jgi:cytochrome o ubiquinol oxidase subunit 1